MEKKENIKKIIFHISGGIIVYIYCKTIYPFCRTIEYTDINGEHCNYNILKIFMNPLLILLVVCFGILLSLFISPRLPNNGISVKILSKFEILMWGIIGLAVLISSHISMLAY